MEAQKGTVNDLDALFKSDNANQQSSTSNNKGTIEDIHGLFKQPVKDLGEQPAMVYHHNDSSIPKEQPSFLADVGSGMMHVGQGIKQGVLYAKDAVTGGHDYDDYTKHVNFEHEDYKQSREDSGKTGYNWGELLGETVATLPAAGFARGLQGAKLLSGAGAKFLGQNAAVGAGIGATQFAKNSEDRLANTALGAVGGAVGAGVGEKVGQGIGKAVDHFKVTRPALENVDHSLDSILSQKGMTLNDLPGDLADHLRQTAISAIKSGKQLDQDAVQRQALLAKLNIKGTQAQVSRNPQQWQQSSELAKTQAGDPLRDKYVKDNEHLTQSLDDVMDKTNGSSIDQYGAMQNAVNSAKSKLDANKENYKNLYDQAYKADGNDVKLDGAGFANDAITALDKNYAASSLPGGLHKLLNDVAKNPDYFTLGKSEELVKVLNREYKASLSNGQPSSGTHAIGLVRDALNGRRDEALQGLLSTGDNDAAKAYDIARQAYKDHATSIQDSKFLQDVQKGVEPDTLFSKHVLNSDIAQLNKTVNFLKDANPQAVSDIRQQVVQFIADNTLKANGDFSPANMSKALAKLGDRRLSTLFSPQEITQLKDISAAAHYLKTEPAHSYVNNSNSSSALFNVLMNQLDKTGVRKLLAPLKDIKDGYAVKKAMQPSVAGNDVPITDSNQNITQILKTLGITSGANSAQ